MPGFTDDLTNAVVLQDQLTHLKTLCSVNDSHPAFDYADYTHFSYIISGTTPIAFYASHDEAMADVFLYASLGIQIYLEEMTS